MKRSAILLVGGMGTRLHPLTLSTPKPMLPVAGVPFTEHQIVKAREAGISCKKLCDANGVLHKKINDWFKQSLQTPAVKDFIAKGAYEASPSSPTELAQEMKIAYERWGEMVKMVGLAKQ